MTITIVTVGRDGFPHAVPRCFLVDDDYGRSQKVVNRALTRIHVKHTGGSVSGVEDIMRAQARKRVVLKVRAERNVSWDHRQARWCLLRDQGSR